MIARARMLEAIGFIVVGLLSVTKAASATTAFVSPKAGVRVTNSYTSVSSVSSLKLLRTCSNVISAATACLAKEGGDDDVATQSAADTVEDVDEKIEKDLKILNSAASTKAEDSDDVYDALMELEKLMRGKARTDPEVAKEMLRNLDGDWRLVFTTGTAKTQSRLKGNRINYFPLKAIQSFRTQTEGEDDVMTIENGIYVGDVSVMKFRGVMEFDLRKRRLEFDFNQLGLFNEFFKVPLKTGEAAQLGSKSGLGSDSNVMNAERGNKPFFNWISADANIATARGGGGGLALWKRI